MTQDIAQRISIILWGVGGHGLLSTRGIASLRHVFDED